MQCLTRVRTAVGGLAQPDEASRITQPSSVLPLVSRAPYKQRRMLAQ